MLRRGPFRKLGHARVSLACHPQANRNGLVGCGSFNDACGNLDLVLVWQILFISIAIMAIIVIPFTVFYYEADDEGVGARKRAPDDLLKRCTDTTNCSRSLGSAFLYTTITVIITALVVAIPFAFLNTTEIPYKVTTISTSNANFFYSAQTTPAQKGCGKSAGCTFSDATLELTVSFVVWLAAMLMLGGWVVFIFYAGVGLVALPLDGINAFRDRPKVLTVAEARNIKQNLLDKTKKLLAAATELGEQITSASTSRLSWSEKRKFKREEKEAVRRLRVLTDSLDDEVLEYQTCEPRAYREHYNPIVPYLKLVGSIVGIVVSVCWVAQIILVVLIQPPVDPLLNNMFAALDGVADFIGTALFALFTFYLLLAVIRGNLKFGTRFFIIKLHPMKPGRTLINSFLFNLLFVLLCVLPVVQLSEDAFTGYTRLTDAGVIFGTQVQYMQFFRYIFETKAHIYALLGVMFLSFLYFLMYPSDREYHSQVMKSIQTQVAQRRTDARRDIDWAGGAGIELKER